MKNMSALHNFLKSLGLKEKDQEIYLALLELADASILQLSLKTGIKRPTIYDSLRRLIDKGLITSYIERGKRRFSAENPAKIKNVIEGMLEAVDKFLPELQKTWTPHSAPKAKIYEGEEGLKKLTEEAFQCKEKMIYSIGSAEIARQAIGTNIGFTRRRVKNKIFAKNIRIKDEPVKKNYLEKQREELREVRFLPKNIKFPAIINIFDNKVAVSASKKERVGFLIESNDFAEAMKTIFQLLWDIAEKPTVR